jgi:GNAT superfamily N-acetyltransferase
MTQNSQWMQRDLAVLWHPCTQMKDHERLPLIPIRRGDGVWLEDFDGKRYLDAVSSWWVNVFGHGNPRINQRIRDQLDSLEHVMLAGFTHAPVVELSERLVQITPDGLSKVFYADNGSSGLEVALRHPDQQLPRRDGGGDVGGRRGAVHRHLQGAAARHHQGAEPGLLPASRGHGLGRTLAQHVRRHGADAGAARP